MAKTFSGIHHVTCITGDVQKCVNFYVSVLGLRFVKKSINQDLPDTYHIYFGDYLGSPGTAMTFFGWPTWPSRRAGSGQVTTVSFAVPHGSLDFWSARMSKLGIDAMRTKRFGTEGILVHDPDGIEVELAGKAVDERWVPWNDGPVHMDNAIRGFHSVTLTVAEATATDELLEKTMGFRKVGEEGSRSRWETGDGGPNATLDLIESPEGPVGEESQGTVHHVAWRTPDDSTQLAWRDALVKVGSNVTPVIDRWYFKSIYYREPGGVLFEIATDSPGFTIDEKPEALGTSLSLPPWFQVRRDRLDETLPPIVVPTTATTGAGH
ncbi:MAG TPA: ring-cleaving dioxygenase [Candidatus Dormibacteraeota bacterium]|nr:ring-cleaving dioxygenase [Candidatus Dormibacteraeota bacterium]